MTLTAITTSLETSLSSGREAEETARLSFLEWLLTLPDTGNAAEAAGLAVQQVQSVTIQSEALKCFCDLMQQASRPLPVPRRKGGCHARTAGRMH